MTEETLSLMKAGAQGTSSHEWHIRLLVAEVRGLREQVARLETELQQERDDAFTEAEHCQRQVTRLRAALERYGQHDEGCEWHDHRWHGQRGPCTCGLAEALTPPAVGED